MAYTEGQTATNKQTGQKIVFRRGEWQPLEDDIGLSEPEENNDSPFGIVGELPKMALDKVSEKIAPHVVKPVGELAAQSDLKKTPELAPTFSENLQTGIEDTLSADNMQPSPYKGMAQAVAPEDAEAVKAAFKDETDMYKAQLSDLGSLDWSEEAKLNKALELQRNINHREYGADIANVIESLQGELSTKIKEGSDPIEAQEEFRSKLLQMIDLRRQEARGGELGARAEDTTAAWDQLEGVLTDKDEFGKFMLTTGVPLAVAYGTGAAGVGTLGQMIAMAYSTGAIDMYMKGGILDEQGRIDPNKISDSAIEGITSILQIPAARGISKLSKLAGKSIGGRAATRAAQTGIETVEEVGQESGSSYLQTGKLPSGASMGVTGALAGPMGTVFGALQGGEPRLGGFTDSTPNQIARALWDSVGADDKMLAARAFLDPEELARLEQEGRDELAKEKRERTVGGAERVVRASESEQQRKQDTRIRRNQLERQGMNKKDAQRQAEKENPPADVVHEVASAANEYSDRVDAGRMESGDKARSAVKSKPAAADGADDPALARENEVAEVMAELQAQGFNEEIAAGIAERAVPQPEPPVEPALKATAEDALEQVPGVKPGMSLREKLQVGVDALSGRAGEVNPEVAAILTEGGVHAVSSLARLFGIPVPFGIDWIVGRRAGAMVKGNLTKAAKNRAVGAGTTVEAPQGRTAPILPGETLTPVVPGQMPAEGPTGPLTTTPEGVSTSMGTMQAPAPVQEAPIAPPPVTTQPQAVPEAIPAPVEPRMAPGQPTTTMGQMTATVPSAAPAGEVDANYELEVTDLIKEMKKDNRFKGMNEETLRGLAEDMVKADQAGKTPPAQAPQAAPPQTPPATPPAETPPTQTDKKGKKRKKSAAIGETISEEEQAELDRRVAEEVAEEDKTFGLEKDDYTPVASEGGGRKKLPVRPRKGPEITQEPITLKKGADGSRSSDAFRSWGYSNESGGVVEVVGKNGDTYRYYGIPEARAGELRTALSGEDASAGKILGALRKEAKRTVRVEDAPPLDTEPTGEGAGGSSVTADLEANVLSNEIKAATGWEVERLGNDKYALFNKAGKQVGEYDSLPEAVKQQARRSKFKKTQQKADAETVNAIEEAEKAAGVTWGEPLQAPPAETGMSPDLESAVNEATDAVEGKSLPAEVMAARDALPAVPDGHTRLWRVEGESAVEAGASGGKTTGRRGWYEESLGAYVTENTKPENVRYVDVPNSVLSDLKSDPNATEVLLTSKYTALSKPMATKKKKPTKKKSSRKGKTAKADNPRYNYKSGNVEVVSRGQEVMLKINGRGEGLFATTAEALAAAKEMGADIGTGKRSASVADITTRSLTEEFAEGLQNINSPEVEELLREVFGAPDAVTTGQDVTVESLNKMMPAWLKGKVRQDGSNVVISTGQGEIRVGSDGNIQISDKTARKWGYKNAADAMAKGAMVGGVASSDLITRDSVIALADNNTFTHEIAHIFLNLFATKGELKNIYKALNKEAERKNMAPEEVFAEGHRKYWESDQEFRDKHKGSALGRIYTKIRDFALAMKDLVMRRSVESQYRKVAKGEVFGRKKGGMVTLDTYNKFDLTPKDYRRWKRTGITPGEAGDTVAVSASVSTNPQTQAALFNQNKKDGVFKDSELREYFKDLNNVAAIMLRDADRFAFTPAVNERALKINSDPHYERSLDFSTLCKRRVRMQATIDALAEAYGRPLEADEIMSVRAALQNRGIETACGACYVDSKRLHAATVLKKGRDGYTDKNGVFHEPLAVPKRLLNTTEGLAEIAEKYPEEFKKVQALFRQIKAKTPEARTEYRGEVLDTVWDPKKGHYGLTPKMVEMMNANSGLRWQSWSDFEVPHVLDAMQAIGDMKSRGLMGHAYTKESDFVRVLAPTGLAINMSLIPKGTGLKNGKLVFDQAQSFNIKEGLAFRKKFGNVGFEAIGVNDDQILAMLDDPNIDYVIPYHASGLGKQYKGMVGMETWVDYTGEQNFTVAGSTKQISKPAEGTPHAGWKGKGKVDGKAVPVVEWGEWNGDIKKLFKLCKERGVDPPFVRFKDHPNYYKLLVDRRIYDAKGKFIEQKVVDTKFDMKAIQKMMKGYRQTDASPVQEVVDEILAANPVKGDAALPTTKISASINRKVTAPANVAGKPASIGAVNKILEKSGTDIKLRRAREGYYYWEGGTPEMESIYTYNIKDHTIEDVLYVFNDGIETKTSAAVNEKGVQQVKAKGAPPEQKIRVKGNKTDLGYRAPTAEALTDRAQGLMTGSFSIKHGGQTYNVTPTGKTFMKDGTKMVEVVFDLQGGAKTEALPETMYNALREKGVVPGQKKTSASTSDPTEPRYEGGLPRSLEKYRDLISGVSDETSYEGKKFFIYLRDGSPIDVGASDIGGRTLVESSLKELGRQLAEISKAGRGKTSASIDVLKGRKLRDMTREEVIQAVLDADSNIHNMPPGKARDKRYEKSQKTLDLMLRKWIVERRKAREQSKTSASLSKSKTGAYEGTGRAVATQKRLNEFLQFDGQKARVVKADVGTGERVYLVRDESKPPTGMNVVKSWDPSAFNSSLSKSRTVGNWLGEHLSGVVDTVGYTKTEDLPATQKRLNEHFTQNAYGMSITSRQVKRTPFLSPRNEYQLLMDGEPVRTFTDKEFNESLAKSRTVANWVAENVPGSKTSASLRKTTTLGDGKRYTEGQIVSNSGRTATSRKGQEGSTHARGIADDVKGKTVIDWGSGQGVDVNFYKKAGAKKVQGYDPNHNPTLPKGKADIVTNSFVGNVVTPGIRRQMWTEAFDHAKEKLFIAVRAEKGMEGEKAFDGILMGKPPKDGSLGSRTFQKFYTLKELLRELKKIFPGQEVTAGKVKGSGVVSAVVTRK